MSFWFTKALSSLEPYTPLLTESDDNTLATTQPELILNKQMVIETSQSSSNLELVLPKSENGSTTQLHENKQTVIQSSNSLNSELGPSKSAPEKSISEIWADVTFHAILLQGKRSQTEVHINWKLVDESKLGCLFVTDLVLGRPMESICCNRVSDVFLGKQVDSFKHHEGSEAVISNKCLTIGWKSDEPGELQHQTHLIFDSLNQRELFCSNLKKTFEISAKMRETLKKETEKSQHLAPMHHTTTSHKNCNKESSFQVVCFRLYNDFNCFSGVENNFTLRARWMSLFKRLGFTLKASSFNQVQEFIMESDKPVDWTPQLKKQILDLIPRNKEAKLLDLELNQALKFNNDCFIILT